MRDEGQLHIEIRSVAEEDGTDQPEGQHRYEIEVAQRERDGRVGQHPQADVPLRVDVGGLVVAPVLDSAVRPVDDQRITGTRLFLADGDGWLLLAVIRDDGPARFLESPLVAAGDDMGFRHNIDEICKRNNFLGCHRLLQQHRGLHVDFPDLHALMCILSLLSFFKFLFRYLKISVCGPLKRMV